MQEMPCTILSHVCKIIYKINAVQSSEILYLSNKLS